MTKSLTPINLKTENFGPLVFRTKDNVIHFYQYYSAMPSMGDEHHNLFFVEDGCKEGDLCLWNIQHEYQLSTAESNNALFHYKIIATTDQSLIDQGIPNIPEEYVRHYAYKNGDIIAVEIETENFYVEPPEGIHSNRGHFIEVPKLKDNDMNQKEVVIFHEPTPIVDWNKFTMTQFIEHLEEEFMFSSTGTAKSVSELIRAYKEMRDGLEWIKKEYIEKVNEQDDITDKIDKLLENDRIQKKG